MRFSRFAGVSIMPVLARIVLAAAFIPTGYHKVVHTQQFEGDAARLLNELNIGGPAEASASASPSFQLASFVQEETATDEETAPEAAAAPAREESMPMQSPAPGAEPVISAEEADAPPPAPVTARSVHVVTTMLVAGGWPKEWKPHYMAWMAGLTELVGGVLILLGLFGRIWGLGLAIAMGFAFYLTSMRGLTDPGLFALGAGADGYAPFNRLMAQSSLLVLAFGVFLTGPGPLSLDRVLFRRKGKGKPASTPEVPEPAYRSSVSPPAPTPAPAPAPAPPPPPSAEMDEDRPSSSVRPL